MQRTWPWATSLGDCYSPTVDRNGINLDGPGISVSETTLDAALASVGPILVLKIDIEGMS